jgi:hypothetical protein
MNRYWLHIVDINDIDTKRNQYEKSYNDLISTRYQLKNKFLYYFLSQYEHDIDG